jgi:hypothetical protein
MIPIGVDTPGLSGLRWQLGDFGYQTIRGFDPTVFVHALRATPAALSQQKTGREPRSREQPRRRQARD